MPLGEAPRDPMTKQVPLLWVVLYLGCLMMGFVLAALIMPVQASVAPLARFSSGLMLVLTVIILSLAAWQLTKAITVPRAAWRWVVLLVAVASGVAVGLWAAASHSPDDSVRDGLTTVFLSALGIAVAAAVAVHALVRILASGAAVGSRGQQPPLSR